MTSLTKSGIGEEQIVLFFLCLFAIILSGLIVSQPNKIVLLDTLNS